VLERKRKWGEMDARVSAENAVFSRSPVKTRVRMLANEPESFALEATCVIVCPDKTAKNWLKAPNSLKRSVTTSHKDCREHWFLAASFLRLVDSRPPAHQHRLLVYGLIVALAREEKRTGEENGTGEELESFSKHWPLASEH
jgi:hypothetical protein